MKVRAVEFIGSDGRTEFEMIAEGPLPTKIKLRYGDEWETFIATEEEVHEPGRTQPPVYSTVYFVEEGRAEEYGL